MGAYPQLGGWSLLAHPAAWARKAREDTPQAPDRASPPVVAGRYQVRQVGAHGVPRTHTLGAGPGPRVRVARAPVARSQGRLKGRSLPCAPATRRRASGRFVSPQLSGSARSLAGSGAAAAGGGARAREPRALATPGGRTLLCRPRDSPAVPGSAQPGMWLSTSQCRTETSFQAHAGERQLRELTVQGLDAYQH